MWRPGAIMVFSFFLAGQSLAEGLPSMFGDRRQILDAWPVLGAGSLQQVEETPAAEEIAGGPPVKSPKKALFLSAILPGAGEFYAGAPKRAALFFGVEAVAWGLYLSWTGKGNDIEDEFRAMADSLWNPQDYLAWFDSPQSKYSETHHELPCKDHVDIYKTTGEFRGCADSEVQQYYELIGKYDQFVAGWKDTRDRSGNPVQPTDIDSVENFISEHRLDYEDRRNDSNRFLKRASNIAGLILINHAISAIDAARVGARAQGADRARLERRSRFLVALQPGSRGRVPMLLAYKPF